MSHAVCWRHTGEKKGDRRSSLFSLSVGTARTLWVGEWGYERCSEKEHSIVSSVLRGPRGDTISGPAPSASRSPSRGSAMPLSHPALPAPPGQTRTDEGSLGAHGLSWSRRESMAAGVCVSAGAGVRGQAPGE